MLEALRRTLGVANVLEGEEDRAFFSQDIYCAAAEPALCVIQPSRVEELAAAVALATAAGHAVVPRGGGSSYTGGFLPGEAGAVLIDTRRLDRIVEIDLDNNYVTVEVGVTWKQLNAALAEKGVRTPFWGPLSGATATIGGALSQNSILWGSARHGVSAESVLALEVILADGSLIRTGSASTRGGTPFFRFYGPDLTGLFLGDCGALGIKARATLRLMPLPAHVLTASFGLPSAEALAETMAAIARAGLASDCFGMDPVLTSQRLKRAGLTKDLKALEGVLTSQSSLARGLKEAAKVVWAGRGFLAGVDFSLHLGTEGRSAAAVEADLGEIRRLVALRGGREVENTIPKVLRGDPFVPMSSAIGPEGERWAPIHALFPLKQAASSWARVRELLNELEPTFAQHGILVGILTAIVGGTAFVLEPVFYWPGPRTLYYQRVLSPSELARFKDFERSPATEAAVAHGRRRLIDLFAELGAAHLQIGKTYPYRERRENVAWALLAAIKQAVDPGGRINPGSLGLRS